MKQLILILFISFAISSYSQDVSYSSFCANKGDNTPWILYKHNNEALYNIITNDAFASLQQRKNKIQQLQTKEDWLAYQNEIKQTFASSLDKFKKTPLNARITGTIKKDNFTVEKIIFESHSDFYVTSCLFIPKKRQKPAPAIIYVSGHSDLAFRNNVYQKVILNLVDKGFIVFAIDPIGQGERLQYLDNEKNKSKIGGSTTEHSYAGVQTLLTGTSLSDYFIWDGVRAIDYLETRKEVDSKRIGITGRSGGGTQSALIAAYDDRIYAAAPECYITNFTRLLQSIGPQDAEQNPYCFIKNGLDHPDFIHMRAPKPTLIVTTTHDFFSQQGARETFAEAQKSFSAIGKTENIQFIEDMGVHESTLKNRETVYAFFQKNLSNPGNKEEKDIKAFPVEDLWVTPTGQLGSSYKGKTIFNLNKQYFSKIAVEKDDLCEKIKEIAGIKFNRKYTSAVFTGKIITENYTIQKYFIENNCSDFALPFLLIKNNNLSSNKILVWLNPEGKEKIVDSELFTKLLNSGHTIISVDLPGVGELKDINFKGDGYVKNVPFNYTFGANLLGKSITGIQIETLDLLIQFIHHEYSGLKISGLAEGGLAETILHYNVLKKSFERLALIHALKSNQSLLEDKYYSPQLAFNVIPGSLQYYDLSDLKELLPPQSVKYINSVNAENKKIETEDNSIIIDFLDKKLMR